MSDPRSSGGDAEFRAHTPRDREEFKLALRNAKTDGFSWLQLIFWTNARTETGARIKSRTATRVLMGLGANSSDVAHSFLLDPDTALPTRKVYSVEVVTRI